MPECPYSEFDWTCCKQEGHDGPHESRSLGSAQPAPHHHEYVGGKCIHCPATSSGPSVYTPTALSRERKA